MHRRLLLSPWPCPCSTIPSDAPRPARPRLRPRRPVEHARPRPPALDGVADRSATADLARRPLADRLDPLGAPERPEQRRRPRNDLRPPAAEEAAVVADRPGDVRESGDLDPGRGSRPRSSTRSCVEQARRPGRHGSSRDPLPPGRTRRRNVPCARSWTDGFMPLTARSATTSATQVPIGSSGRSAPSRASRTRRRASRPAGAPRRSSVTPASCAASTCRPGTHYTVPGYASWRPGSNGVVPTLAGVEAMKNSRCYGR